MSYDVSYRFRNFLSRLAGPVDDFGEQALFYGQTVRYVPNALTRYRKETIRLIAEMTLGAGALIMIGGTVGVAAFLTGATAQLGAMRVSEEIDAVECMAVHSVSYLVSTRLIAGLVAIVPLYSLSVLAAFFAARFTTVFVNGQSAGLYDHYFNTFLIPSDLLWSFLQAIVMSIAVMLVHTYYGYNASGGPVGVGIAVGQAVRTSLIVVVVITLFISLAVYGAQGNFNLSG
jgi:phospholipid/cholesterol/gamma-HCH transport system permease protein